MLGLDHAVLLRVVGELLEPLEVQVRRVDHVLHGQQGHLWVLQHLDDLWRVAQQEAQALPPSSCDRRVVEELQRQDQLLGWHVPVGLGTLRCAPSS